MICPHCGKPISRTITAIQKKQIFELHSQGFSSRDIQTKTGASFSSVCRILRQLDELRQLDALKKDRSKQS